MNTDRSLRSVFVGNIPYDATEERLRELFSQVGPVISFRLVFDRDSGKPKGYGFCEFRDQETAQSAIRNLQNAELNGRNLRVDSAANEKNRDEMNRNMGPGPGGVGGPPIGPPGMMGGPPGPFGPGQGGFSLGPGGPMNEPSLYGPPVDPDTAPEVVANVVASLPPEQMFELAKQMKNCILQNPQEAKEMLLQNPQLAYALLQSLVVMKIVDPQVAISVLQRPHPSNEPIMPPGPIISVGGMPPTQFNPGFLGPSPRDPRAAGIPVAAVDPRVDPRIRADPRLVNQMDHDHRGGNLSQDALLQMVLTMSDEEIQRLDPQQRNAVLEIKREMARSGRN